MSEYPQVDDEAITGWGPGAAADGLEPDRPLWDFDGGFDALLAFTDIGDGGAGPRAQLVAYAARIGGERKLRAVSVELTPEEARAAAYRLLWWSDRATDWADEDAKTRLLPGPDDRGADGDWFDAFELHDVAEYETADGDRFCEPLDTLEPQGDERTVNRMISLYGHFTTGGMHCITDSVFSADNPREKALDYMRRLAGSIAAGRRVEDYTL